MNNIRLIFARADTDNYGNPIPAQDRTSVALVDYGPVQGTRYVRLRQRWLHHNINTKMCVDIADLWNEDLTPYRGG